MLDHIAIFDSSQEAIFLKHPKVVDWANKLSESLAALHCLHDNMRNVHPKLYKIIHDPTFFDDDPLAQSYRHRASNYMSHIDICCNTISETIEIASEGLIRSLSNGGYHYFQQQAHSLNLLGVDNLNALLKWFHEINSFVENIFSSKSFIGGITTYAPSHLSASNVMSSDGHRGSKSPLSGSNNFNTFDEEDDGEDFEEFEVVLKRKDKAMRKRSAYK